MYTGSTLRIEFDGGRLEVFRSGSFVDPAIYVGSRLSVLLSATRILPGRIFEENSELGDSDGAFWRPRGTLLRTL